MIIKWLWEVIWLFKNDKPDWEHIVKAEDWRTYKINYEKWVNVWDLTQVTN
jgi:hypothetical protein